MSIMYKKEKGDTLFESIVSVALRINIRTIALFLTPNFIMVGDDFFWKILADSKENVSVVLPFKKVVLVILQI